MWQADAFNFHGDSIRRSASHAIAQPIGLRLFGIAAGSSSLCCTQKGYFILTQSFIKAIFIQPFTNVKIAIYREELGLLADTEAGFLHYSTLSTPIEC